MSEWAAVAFSMCVCAIVQLTSISSPSCHGTGLHLNSLEIRLTTGCHMGAPSAGHLSSRRPSRLVTVLKHSK